MTTAPPTELRSSVTVWRTGRGRRQYSIRILDGTPQDEAERLTTIALEAADRIEAAQPAESDDADADDPSRELGFDG